MFGKQVAVWRWMCIRLYIAVSIGAISSDIASKLVAETKRIAAMFTRLTATLEPTTDN